MQSYGIVRKVDQLGRIVLPIELRRTLKMEIGDPVEIFVEGDSVILKKYDDRQSCDITGEKASFSLFDGQLNLSEEGCSKLLHELKQILDNQ